MSPAVSVDAAWPQVKPRIIRDARFLAVADRRRRELFELYMSGLREAAAATEEARAVAERAVGGKAAPSAAVAIAPVGGQKPSSPAAARGGPIDGAASAGNRAPEPALASSLSSSTTAPSVDMSRIDVLRKEQVRSTRGPWLHNPKPYPPSQNKG